MGLDSIEPDGIGWDKVRLDGDGMGWDEIRRDGTSRPFVASPCLALSASARRTSKGGKNWRSAYRLCLKSIMFSTTVPPLRTNRNRGKHQHTLQYTPAMYLPRPFAKAFVRPTTGRRSTHQRVYEESRDGMVFGIRAPGRTAERQAGRQAMVAEPRRAGKQQASAGATAAKVAAATAAAAAANNSLAIRPIHSRSRFTRSVNAVGSRTPLSRSDLATGSRGRYYTVGCNLFQ